MFQKVEMKTKFKLFSSYDFKKTYNLAKNMTSGHLGYTKIEKNPFFMEHSLTIKEKPHILFN